VSSRVIIRGWCGEHDLLPPTVRATVALEALSCTVEQELASAARTIEYLGCGVPVVYSSWGEVAEHIREYEAGWLINSAEVGEIRGVIDQIFSSPEEVRRRGRNAERLMQDRFTWDQTIEPLIQFLSSPKKGARGSRASALLSHRLRSAAGGKSRAAVAREQVYSSR
jgi:hypothetical protein